MNNLRRYASKSVAWGALSIVCIGGATYKGYEAAEQRSIERDVYIENTEDEISLYLEQLPELRAEIEGRQSETRLELDSMESRLGAACLARMLNPPTMRSFDEALTPTTCTEFTDEQLERAKAFYSRAASKHGYFDELFTHLVDDPDNNRDTVDSLKYYSSGGAAAELSDIVQQSTVPPEASITSPYPESAVVIVPSGDSYSMESITDPSMAPTRGYLPFWEALLTTGVVSLGASIVYANRARIAKRVAAKRDFRQGNIVLRTQAELWREIDDEQLGNELEEIRRELG